MGRKDEEHRRQRCVVETGDQQCHLHRLVRTLHLRGEYRTEIALAVDVKSVSQGGFHIKFVPDIQSFDADRTHIDSLAPGQTDVVARLGFHAVENSRFIGRQVHDDCVGRQNVGIGFTQIPLRSAVIELKLLKLIIWQSEPVALRIEIFSLAPVRFPVQIIAQGHAVLRKVRTQRFGQLFQKTAVILFRRLDLWTVREIGDVILGVQVLKECDEVALRMCIAACIGVNFAVADRKIKCPGIHSQPLLHFRPERCLLDDRRTVSIDHLFRFDF